MKPTAAHLIFLQNQNAAGNPAWNLSSYLLFEKKFSPELLEAGLNEITAKNDALRLRPVFLADRVEFEVDPFVPRTYERFCFETTDQFLAWANERINVSVFHQPNMWTAYIIEVAGKIGVMNVGHHGMSDGYNVVILYQKLLQYVSGESPEVQSYLPRLEADIRYHDSKRFQRDRQFWDEQLRLPFAMELFRNAVQQPDGRCMNRHISLPSDLVLQMEAFCAAQEISESVLVYGATALTVYALCREERFSLGIPVLGRSTHLDMQALGLYMHIVPMIVEIDDLDFSAFLHTVEERLFDLFRHQSFTAYDISGYSERPELHRTLYEIAVDYSEYRTDAAYESHVLYNSFSSMPMELHFLKQEAHALDYTIRVWDSLADEPLAARFSDVFLFVLKAIVQTPAAVILHTSFLTPEEQHKILRTFNATVAPYDSSKSIYDRFLEQVQ